jgi:endonuclease/exonuclease/phosphatase family metal-dependent hydrolase
MSRMLRVLLFIPLVFGLAACADRGVESPLAPTDAALALGDGPGITVMSQNMYLGANIDLLLTAESAEEVGLVFQQLATSNAGDFGRAAKLALQIVEHAPHLVGLQEVTTYAFDFGGGPVVLDYLDVLLQYLNYFHYVAAMTPYTWAAYRNELATPDPFVMPGFPAATYVDADAILVRSDVEVLGAATLEKFAVNETFSVAGNEFVNWRGYMAVTASVGGHLVRFGNTHLEVQHYADTQEAQAAEMIAAFADETIPVILVGDFNSAANPHAPDAAKTASYRMFRNAGYADIWLREAHSVGGATCCQAPDLTNPESLLDERLDLVLVRWGKAGFGGRTSMDVIGEEPGDRITVMLKISEELSVPVTLWPSDHAGVVATLWPAPGQAKKLQAPGRR